MCIYVLYGTWFSIWFTFRFWSKCKRVRNTIGQKASASVPFSSYRTYMSRPSKYPANEQRRLSTSFGFRVAKRYEVATTEFDRQLRNDARVVAPPAAQPGNHKVNKKKKKANPYAGPSGPFSKKPRWTKRRHATPPNVEQGTITLAPSAVSVLDDTEEGPCDTMQVVVTTE